MVWQLAAVPPDHQKNILPFHSHSAEAALFGHAAP
jgi:hypothetical protein